MEICKMTKINQLNLPEEPLDIFEYLNNKAFSYELYADEIASVFQSHWRDSIKPNGDSSREETNHRYDLILNYMLILENNAKQTVNLARMVEIVKVENFLVKKGIYFEEYLERDDE
ncbi:hypothetical protein COU54_03285 [Candidatus Pacearchaeota archaeon CG10_big_fil_rev_8_21_14_0_10_31_24]|nr:MAG: hypothetical protein COU54_03285 [Candidatus Pacearchaeota archaeon CG10_big_fil_rev_8_21_14_0_10_31_24]